MVTSFTPPFTRRGLAQLVTPTPREELADLGLRGITSASAGYLGITIKGAVDA